MADSAMNLTDKVIAITGAASGIGLQLSRFAASRGAKLALADLNQEALDKVVSEISANGVQVVGTRVNVTSNQEVDDWINATVKHFGALHGAANLAGVEGGKKIVGPLSEVTNEDWDFTLSVNLTGLMYCLRAQVRVMQAGGSIVNAASTAGLMGRPGLSAYSTSKHAVVGLTKTVAKEVGSKGIRVNAVAPGPIETPMIERLLEIGKGQDLPFAANYSTLPIGRMGKPDEIARLITFLLSDDSSFITGVICPADGGMTA